MPLRAPAASAYAAADRPFGLRDSGLETKGRLEIGDVVVDSLRDADHAEFEAALSRLPR